MKEGSESNRRRYLSVNTRLRAGQPVRICYSPYHYIGHTFMFGLCDYEDDSMELADMVFCIVADVQYDAGKDDFGTFSSLGKHAIIKRIDMIPPLPDEYLYFGENN